ncbi:cysteine--tRNA ligase [Sulfurospirillum sp. T05]|uniref:Cysteine--tRNA ligase n=1 Tax=Sulfurospirillum tamanense TaxID=2813362 RepID=A0ABS2WR53_9BACT|nr:cysteine--tRNA ligase [Sulfurospirillum tamanensis]
MVIYDSTQKKKVPFEPIKTGEATIYVCGPTVYDDAHLGHARSAIAFDLLRRTLEALNYKVTFVKNFTDIDDKIIAKMDQTGQSLETLTTHYIERYKEDMRALHVKDASLEPKATQSLPSMIRFIETLLAKGAAYTLDDGVYFDTSKDEGYLSLSHQHIEETKARVEGNSAKRNPKDFALWKRSTQDPVFDSPFGKGRPGWHIECSAMIQEHLAHEGPYQIDIHAGGADLLFPHHENEAAQTRCASGQHLAKYWMHNGFVTINGDKMSKSLGNSFFVKDALHVYDGEVLRFYLLSSHYRADFNFNEDDLLSSKRRLDKLYRLKKRLQGTSPSQKEEHFTCKVLEALSDDLNISKALAILDEMILQGNEALDKAPKDTVLKQTLLANLTWIEEVLGIGLHSPIGYFQLGVSQGQKTQIQQAIEARQEAKKAKDFAKADAIRDALLTQGIQLMDTSEGTQWERIIG